MFDVITVGSSTIDAFAQVESELIKIRTANYNEDLIAYPSGSKILIKDLVFLTGGGGTNTAVSFSRLGLKTGYLGKVGNDANSQLIMSQLRKEKIKFLGRKARGMSGYSIILDSIEGDRTILTYKGVNDTLDFKEINLKKLKTRWFYFSSMIGKSYETLEKLSEFAEKNSINIAFNPSNYLASKGKNFLSKLLSRTYLLVLNKEEAGLIAGNLEMKSLFIELMKLGPKLVVITDGKRGAYCYKDKLYHVLASDIKPVETTGAGDAFASTFLATLIKKKDIEYALKMASKNAESVILNKGAKMGLLTWKKLVYIVKKNQPKVNIIT